MPGKGWVYKEFSTLNAPEQLYGTSLACQCCLVQKVHLLLTCF